MKFPIAIFKDPDSDYGVVFPDLPGCISAGDTFDDAIEMAKDAVECHLEGMIKDNDPFPVIGNIESHKSDPDYQNAIWAEIEVDLSKLSITLYPVEFTPEEEGGFVISFPDFPEAISQGETVENCLKEATDCLEETVAGRMDDGEEIPQPSEVKKYSVYVKNA